MTTCSLESIDECFLGPARSARNTPVNRHFRCIGGQCVQHKYVNTRKISFDHMTLFKQTEDEIIQQIGEYLTNVATLLYHTWDTQTTTRTLKEEDDLPLRSLVILLLNRCAVNLVTFLSKQAGDLVLQPILVSISIGWICHWKKAFQGPQDRQYHQHIRNPWLTLFSLRDAIQRMIHLASLVRCIPRYYTQLTELTYVSDTKELALDKLTIDRRPSSTIFLVEETITGILSIVTSGRLHPNGSALATSFIIPKYDTSHGYLYAYFADTNRSMMCTASTQLITSLLSFALPDQTFGIDTGPAHVWSVFISGETYYEIETTRFNAQTFSAAGCIAQFQLTNPKPRTSTPYVYAPHNNPLESRVLTLCRKALRLEGPEIDIFPYGPHRSTKVYTLPVERVERRGDDRIRIVFAPCTKRERKLFQWEMVTKLLAQACNIVEADDGKEHTNPFEADGMERAYRTIYTDSHRTLDLLFLSNKHIDRVFHLYSELTTHLEKSIYTGIYSTPQTTSTREITSMMFNNLAITILDPPPSHLVIYGTRILPDDVQIALHTFLSGFRWDSISTLPDGDIRVELDITTHWHELGTIIDRLDPRIRVEIKRSPLTEYHIIHNDMLTHTTKGERLNKVYHKYSISDLLSYEWYLFFTYESTEHHGIIRHMVEEFEKNAIACTDCRQKRITELGSAQSQFLYLKGLDLQYNRRSNVRKRSSRSLEDKHTVV